MKHKYAAIGVAWAAFACANATGAPEIGQRSDGEGKFLERSGAAVPRQYIVVLRDDPGARLERLDRRISQFAASKGMAITQVWRSALNGMVISNVDAADARALAKVGGVLSVEPDSYLSSAAMQSNAPAGLDLVDQRTLNPDGTYVYNYTGAGVHAYVVDQGIWTAHPDFGGRADLTQDFVGDEQVDDGGDHGTPVASAIGGAISGVAKGISLHSIRVLDANGVTPLSNAVNGLDWIDHHGIKPAVVNESFTGINATYETAGSLDRANQKLVNDGFVVAVGAGNGQIGALLSSCDVSPGHLPDVITTGAYAAFSMNGPCTDLFAPGSNVVLAHTTGGFQTYNGTSFSTAYTAGAAALVLQQFPSLKPWQVSWELIARSTRNLLVESTGSFELNGAPNRWLDSRPLSYTTTPSVPSVLQRDTCASGHYSAYWEPGTVNASNLSTYFELQRSTSSTFGTIASTYVEGSFANGLEDFASATPLYFRVRACNSLGCSAFKSSTPATCH